MVAVFVTMCLFFSLSCIRSKFSWLVPANVAVVNFVMKVFLTPRVSENGHGDFENVIWCSVVTLSAFGLWLLRYYRERTERELWGAHRQQAEGAAAKEHLLNLMFEFVVRVQDDRVIMTEEFAAMFGQDVQVLGDLPTVNDNPDDATELRSYVKEACLTRIPLKRDFTFVVYSRGKIFESTVCATVTNSGEVLLGIHVNEKRNLERKNAFGPDAGPEPQVASPGQSGAAALAPTRVPA